MAANSKPVAVGARWGVAAVFVAVALAPLVYGFARALADPPSADAPALWDAAMARLLARSVGVAAGAALGATALGAAVGLLLEGARPRGRWVLWYGVAAAFLIPHYAVAVAWIEILGEHGHVARAVRGLGLGWAPPNLYTARGAVFVMSLVLYPIAAVAAALGLRRLDGRWREAAALSVGPLRRWTGVVLPLLAPYIIAAFCATFLLALLEFALPSLLQVTLYTERIHTRFNAFYDMRGGMLLGLPLAGAGVAVVALAWAAWRQRFDAPQARAMIVSSAPFRYLAFIIVALVVVVTAGLPLAALLYRAWPLSSMVDAWVTAREEVAAGALLGAGTASCVVALGGAMAWTAHVRPRWRAGFASTLLPYLVTGPTLAIALILLWNHSDWRGIVYDSPMILILASTARYLFIGYFGALIAARLMNRGWFEAAELAGIPSRRQLMGLTLPLLAPWLALVGGFVFLLGFTEVDTAVLLAPPGYTPVSVRVFGLMHYGPDRLVAALCLLLVAVILAALAAMHIVAAYALRFADACARI